MNTLLRIVWVLQALLLLAVGGLFAVGAKDGRGLADALLHMGVFDTTGAMPHLRTALENIRDFREVARHQLELFGPLSLGLGLLSAQLLRPSFAWLRASLAASFALAWFLATCVFAWVGAPAWALTLTAAFTLFNGAYRLRGEFFEVPPSARPSAGDEAPLLGRLWVFQMLYYALGGALLILFPDQVHSSVFGGDPGSFETSALRALGTLYLAMALLSHNAIGAQTDETWRGYCLAFLTAQLAGVAFMIIGTVRSDASPSIWSLAVIVPAGVLGLVNGLVLTDRRWLRRFVLRLWRTMDFWWLVLVAVLAVIVLRTAIWPADVLATLAETLGTAAPESGSPRTELARDLIALVSPMGVGFLLLLVTGILRRDGNSRNDMALLVVIWGVCVLLVPFFGVRLESWNGSALHPLAWLGLALVALAVSANLLVVVLPRQRARDEFYQGVADTKPRWVYALSVAQAVTLGAFAAVSLWFPADLADLVLQDGYSYENDGPLLASVVRGTAPFWAVMAATSAYAAARAQEWAWRGLCRFFSLWQAAYALWFVYVFDSHTYGQGVLVWPTLLAGFAIGDMYATRVPLRPLDLAGEPKPDGWLSSDLGPGLPMVLSTLARRARAYHRVGVGATGTFVPHVSSLLPAADFFSPRKGPMLCTVRFSNHSSADDASLDARGCALRLTWPDDTTTLDLLLSTGAFGQVRNVAQAALLQWSPASLRRQWLRRSHAAREGAIARLRRAPSSFTHLRYHSQLVRLWQGTTPDGEVVARRCRLRLVPESGDESGLPDAQDEGAVWEADRRADEQRPPDYLRRELEDRLSAGPARMRLQVQIHQVAERTLAALDDDGAWFDATLDWDEREHPWVDVGAVVLDKVLAAAATELLSFASGRGAGVIVTPSSPSWHDPRSLAATQDRAMRGVGELRLTLARILGHSAGPTS